MTIPLFAGVALFGVGVCLGLIFGPSSEREDAANIKGWIDGFEHGRRDPLSKDQDHGS